jgi:hypothetical protein
MRDDEKSKSTPSVGDRFPNLKQLEEDVERSKLERSLAEARAGTAAAAQPKEPAPPKAPDFPKLDLDVTADTVTKSDYVTGLARVFVQMDATALADDIADAALNAARADGAARKYSFRVVHDATLLSGVDTHRLLAGQLTHLQTRLDDVVPAQKDERRKKKEQSVVPELALATVAAGITLAVQAIGALSKLFAHDYQVSGREVSPDDLGLDIDIAHFLIAKKKSDETVTVAIDRLMPTPPSAEIVTDTWTLADASENRLLPHVRTLAHAHAEAKSRVETTRIAITAVDDQIKELTKLVPAAHEDTSDARAELENARKRRDELGRALPPFEAALADTQHDYDRGVGLLRDIEAFLTAVLSPGAAGGRAPLLDAARAEVLAVPASPDSDELRLVVYAKLIAAGVDQTIDAKRLRDDEVRALAGATAEFAVLSSTALLDSGVRSAIQSSNLKLTDDDSFKQHRLNYVGLQRE